MEKLLDVAADRRIIIGVQAVQGCGKSSVCKQLTLANPLIVDTISIDDFYLSESELNEWRAATFCGRADDSGLFDGRGNPGTHDTLYLITCLARFKNNQTICVPVFDKFAKQGRGDRIGWRNILPECRVLFVEGWCVGFLPLQGREAGHAVQMLDAEVARLSRINAYFDGMIIFRVRDYRVSRVWRRQAEERNAALQSKSLDEQRRGMTDDELHKFMNRYEVTYDRYLRHFYERIASAMTCLFVDVDDERVPVAVCTKKHQTLEPF